MHSRQAVALSGAFRCEEDSAKERAYSTSSWRASPVAPRFAPAWSAPRSGAGTTSLNWWCWAWRDLVSPGGMCATTALEATTSWLHVQTPDLAAGSERKTSRLPDQTVEAWSSGPRQRESAHSRGWRYSLWHTLTDPPWVGLIPSGAA